MVSAWSRSAALAANTRPNTPRRRGHGKSLWRFTGESHPLLSPRDGAWFEWLCGSPREEVTVPEETDRWWRCPNSTWIKYPEEKREHIWVPSMGSPSITVSQEMSSCFDLRRTSALQVFSILLTNVEESIPPLTTVLQTTNS